MTAIKHVRLYGGPLEHKTAAVHLDGLKVVDGWIPVPLTHSVYYRSRRRSVETEWTYVTPADPHAAWAAQEDLPLQRVTATRKVPHSAVTSTVGYLIGEVLTSAALNATVVISESLTVGYTVDRSMTEIMVTAYAYIPTAGNDDTES